MFKEVICFLINIAWTHQCSYIRGSHKNWANLISKDVLTLFPSECSARKLVIVGNTGRGFLRWMVNKPNKRQKIPISVEFSHWLDAKILPTESYAVKHIHKLSDNVRSTDEQNPRWSNQFIQNRQNISPIERQDLWLQSNA